MAGIFTEEEQTGILKIIAKPVTKEAVLFDGSVKLSVFIAQWSDNKVLRAVADNELEIVTLEGTMTASVGDYIIKGLRGEFYPCKPDVFHKTYNIVKETK